MTTRVVFLRPGELAAYRVGQDIGKGLRGLGQAAAKAGPVRQMVTDLDKRLVATRRPFWSCWQARCGEAGARWIDCSQALREKDGYHLSQQIIDAANQLVHGSRGNQMTALFQSLAVRNPFDFGAIAGCSDELLANPAQRDDQACRDAVEMAMRPRN